MPYEVVIGLEIHAELATNTKIYCGCINEFGGEPNTHCCPICMGLPGVLPVLNKQVVDYAIKAGLATNCTISSYNRQDRKHYFYPDLPKAFQTSQGELPICRNGYIDIEVGGETKRIRLHHIHIEEDAGKLNHRPRYTLVDCNRGGVPLIEIVTEPDLRSAEEARVFLETLKSILEYTQVSDCKMQEGSLRCDVNISVRPVGQKEFGTRIEMKNISSFRAACRAIEYEAQRQIDELEAGNTIVQETRGWNDEKGYSYSLRTKENAHDYRYFPEPDLPPIVIDEAWVEAIRATLPELPRQRRERYMAEYGLSEYEAGQITTSVHIADLFEGCVQAGGQPKAACNWLLGDIAKILKDKEMEPADIPFTAEQLAKFLKLIEDGTINLTSGKKVMEAMFEDPKDPSEIVREKGFVQISDQDALRKAVIEVLQANPGPVADYKGGKEKAFAFLMGQAMRSTKGRGNPQIIRELLLEELNKQ